MNYPKLFAIFTYTAAVFVGGIIVGGISGKSQQEPETVYQQKIAGDKRDFLYVQPSYGQGVSFVRVGPSEFRRLDCVVNEQNELNNAQNKSIDSKIKNSLNNILSSRR